MAKATFPTITTTIQAKPWAKCRGVTRKVATIKA